MDWSHENQWGAHEAQVAVGVLFVLYTMSKHRHIITVKQLWPAAPVSCPPDLARHQGCRVKLHGQWERVPMPLG